MIPSAPFCSLSSYTDIVQYTGELSIPRDSVLDQNQNATDIVESAVERVSLVIADFLVYTMVLPTVIQGIIYSVKNICTKNFCVKNVL